MPWIDYASHLYFQISSDNRADWASDDPAVWSEESFDILLEGAYDIGDGTIGEPYYEQNIDFVELRIQQGQHLALFGSCCCCGPIHNAHHVLRSCL